ncbi:cytochrome P450 72A397-like [Euphorbia lathyris]|uniref:cytochrome P450 72A397-like n=1 Tax=Euphorbia lathyris TaxID=212925 RepID=UPI003313A91E
MGLLGLGLGLLLLSVILINWGIKMVIKIWWRPKMLEKKLRKQGDFHVLPYKIPYGNVKEMRELGMKAKSKAMQLNHDIAPRLDPFLQGLTTTFKKPIVMWYGGIPNVVIMDPKLVREILTKKMEFKKPEITPTMKFFLKGLANIDGDKWSLHRKIINPAFHIEKLKGMLPSFMVCCEEMVEKWEKMIGEEDCVELDVLIEFQKLTADIISRAAFGSNLQEGNLIFALQRQQGKYFLQSLFSLTSPWSRLLLSKLKKKMMQIHREIQVILEGVIKKREKAILSGSGDQKDLLDLLLKSNFDEIENNKNNKGMSREDVIEECKLFYFAGHETTANLLTWTIICLSMDPKWQDKARKEVLQLIGKNRPTFDDLNQLKIVNMILLEVLRLYPPTSLMRTVQEETKIGDYTFPGGIMFTIPTYLIHRDPNLWGEDANEFNPDRFSDGISKATKDQSCFFAFGWGPRICIGQNFAMLEAKLALVLILQHFSFGLSSSYAHSPHVSITLQPQFGAQIILNKI